MAYSPKQTVLNAVTAAQTTSGIVAVADYSKISLQFIATGISSGNGIFQVQVSNDGTNWVYYNRLTSNLTNTNGQTDTRVASVTLSANGSSVAFFPENDTMQYIRVINTRTTDGTYSAILSMYGAGQ